MSSVEESEEERLLESCRLGDYKEVEKNVDQKFMISLFIEPIDTEDFLEQDNYTTQVSSFLEIRDDYGDTPLIISSRNGYTDIVLLLLLMGASPKTVNNDGSNCLIEASENGKVETVSFLLRRNLVDPNVQDNEGYTA